MGFGYDKDDCSGLPATLPSYTIGLNIKNIKHIMVTEKRKRGQKYPEGYIKKQILLKLCHEDRIETSEIIDHLKEHFGISDTKGVREHLKNMENHELVKRESAGAGHPDYWFVNPDPNTFGILLLMFVETHQSVDFLNSKYCTDIIRDRMNTQLSSLKSDQSKDPDVLIKDFLHPHDGVHHFTRDVCLTYMYRLQTLMQAFYPLLPETIKLTVFLARYESVLKGVPVDEVLMHHHRLSSIEELISQTATQSYGER